MALEFYLSLLRERTNWQAARAVLTMCSYRVGQGWDGTLAKFKEDPKAIGDASQLGKAIVEAVLFGDKNVRLYESTSDAAQAVYDLIKSDPESISGFLSALSLVDIINNTSDGTIIHKSFYTDEFACVLRFAKRQQMQRVVIEMDDSHPDQVRNFMSEFTRIYGEKFVSYVACDSMYVDLNKGCIATLADARRGISLKEIDDIHTNVISGHKLCNPLSRLRSINLLYAVEYLYKSDFGRVVELSFAVGTDSVKHELMRKHRGQDLRTESYHVGGKAVLKSEISPYKISIEEIFSFPGEVSLAAECLIWGKLSSLSDGNVDTLFLYNVITRSQLDIFIAACLSAYANASLSEEFELTEQVHMPDIYERIILAVKNLPANEAKFLTIVSIAKLVGEAAPRRDVISAIFKLSSFDESNLLIERYSYVKNDGSYIDLPRNDVLFGMSTGKFEDPDTGILVDFPKERVFPYYERVEAVH
jgi:hypothetical protein